ncbi:MAG: hypothetical protein EXS05_17165 [Planctomycetaceae bacterium]|nr:hypothetical protein [Planctomycetaceae bacterium]
MPSRIIRVIPYGGAFQWSASFDGRPQTAFGGNTAIVAVRRLLEGTEAAADQYTVLCDQPIPGIINPVTWNPPELLAVCPECEGRGDYVGLQEVERCGGCRGRGVVAL